MDLETEFIEGDSAVEVIIYDCKLIQISNLSEESRNRTNPVVKMSTFSALILGAFWNKYLKVF